MSKTRVALLICLALAFLLFPVSPALAQVPGGECGQLTSITTASLTPNQGAAGSSVTVSGQINPPILAPGIDETTAGPNSVSLFWGGSAASFVVDQNLNFSGTIGVPADAPVGSNIVKLQATGDPQAYCLSFTVLAVQQQAYSTSLPATGSMPALPLAGLLFGAGGAVLYRQLSGRGARRA